MLIIHRPARSPTLSLILPRSRILEHRLSSIFVVDNFSGCYYTFYKSRLPTSFSYIQTSTMRSERLPSVINTLSGSELLKPLQRRVYPTCFYRNGQLATRRAHSIYIVRRIPLSRDQSLVRLRVPRRLGTVRNGTLQPELSPC